MVTYTIRPVFWAHKVNKKDLGPIMIAVTISRKVRYFKTNFKVRKEEWNGSQITTVSNAALMNKAIRTQIDEIEADILNRDLSGELVTSRSVKNTQLTNFFDFATEVNKNMPAPTRRRFKCESNRLKNYAGPSLEIKDLTTHFLRNYEQHERGRGQAQNTLNTTIRWIKSILNKARKEGLLKALPIYQTPKYINPDRIYLVEEERQQWLKYWREKKVEGPMYNTLTWFLFGCYSGLRHSDWEQFDYDKRVEGELLKVRARKNGVWVIMPIGKTLAELIAVVRYLPKPLSGDKTRAYLKIISGRLECKRTITTHTARHTFGAMCAQLKLPKSTAAELMGISEKVVNVYYHLTGENILDQAAILKTI